MTEKILSILFVFIKFVVAATGYSGIALLMAIESACIPLPSELIMPFAGYLAYEGSMKLLWPQRGRSAAIWDRWWRMR
jgi:membrane protein DedA with SNARE-associated domain